MTPYERLMAWLETPEGHDDTRRALESAILRNFPGHKWHVWDEGDVEYDGAMMVSVDVKCECGQTLTVTREMLEDE